MLQLAALKALPLKWIGLALLVAALVVQTLRLDAAKSEVRALKYERAVLEALNLKLKEEQERVTADNIAKTRERIVKVEVPAKRVENAPLGSREKCETPREILESPDL